MKTDIPTVNYLPEELIPEKEIDKFVQFTVNNNPYLRLGPNYGTHDQIVEAFCKELGISFRKRDLVIYPDDPNVEIVGAGCMYCLDREYIYYGDSFGYRIGPNKEHMLKIATQFPDKKFVSKDA